MSTNDASGRATSNATPMSSSTSTAGGAGAGATDVSAAFALTLSVVSSVSIVIVNKHLISILGFREGAVRDACFLVCFASVRPSCGRRRRRRRMFCGNFSGTDLNSSKDYDD